MNKNEPLTYAAGEKRVSSPATPWDNAAYHTALRHIERKLWDISTDPEDVFHHLSYSLAPFEVVIVPGLDGSGPEHWQSRWQKVFAQNNCAVRRVRQENWAEPSYDGWLKKLASAVARSKKPVLLVAHSLGSILAVHAAHKGLLANVAGALLVAPADVENSPQEEARRVEAFSPVPLSQLPFPALVVASRNDPWLSVRRARLLARYWGATFVDAGRVGHIGNQSELGCWLDGLLFLDRLAQGILLDRQPVSQQQKKVLQ